MTRRYQSPIRDERATRTRAALLDACEALLLESAVEEVTLPAVARKAGVTKPTAYSYFPDNDALLAGFLDHVRDRIGMLLETLVSISPADLPSAARDNYRRFEGNARLLRRIMDSPSYDRVRLSRKVDRAAMTMPVWKAARSALPERVLRSRLGPVYLFITPVGWRWLRETWGLSGEEAADAAAWAVESLASALEAPRDRRSRTPKPRSAVERKKEKRS